MTFSWTCRPLTERRLRSCHSSICCNLGTPPSEPPLHSVGVSGQRLVVSGWNRSGIGVCRAGFPLTWGGSLNESGGSIAVDATGNTYVVGSTASANFPATIGSLHGSYDVFVVKLRPDGTLAWAGLYGGSVNEFPGSAFALDGSGNLYVTGNTGSDDFPTTAGAFDETYNGPYSNAFVMKLDAATGAVVYSTFLGGSDGAEGTAISVDASGNAYVTGMADGSFPTTAGAFQTTSNGGLDGFVTKLNSVGSALVYSTFLSGSNISQNDFMLGIAVDGFGNAYVAGMTQATDFPTTAGRSKLYTAAASSTVSSQS